MEGLAAKFEPQDVEEELGVGMIEWVGDDIDATVIGFSGIIVASM